MFPDLWPTARAVEGWLRKNPLDPSISIIRLWGVLVDYKPERQRSWSKALVRHGADAREAIAAVLGVPAEQIGVRDCASYALFPGRAQTRRAVVIRLAGRQAQARQQQLAVLTSAPR